MPLSTKAPTILKSVALGAGSIMLLSLGIAGASAAPTGNFLVKSVNEADSSIFSLEGNIPTKAEGPGDGGTIENPADAVLYTLKCGPASFPVTESMRELSNGNAATYEATGQLDGLAPHADGWSLLAADNRIGEAIPAEKPGSLTLIGTSPTRVMGSVSESAAGCNYNMVDKSKLGLHLYTHTVSSGRYIEGRTVGSTYIQMSASTTDSAFLSISRSVPPVTGQDAYYAVKSETVPYAIDRTADLTRVVLALPTTTDGYNHIESGANPDGSGWVQFKFGANPTIDSNNFPLANRQAGPSYAEYNAAGLITKATYTNSSGADVVVPLPAPYSVADYNAHTGQNWDGNLYKPSSFDLSIPFQPTAPTA